MVCRELRIDGLVVPHSWLSWFITPMSLWFMADITIVTIVNGVYKPTYNWGAPSRTENQWVFPNIGFFSFPLHCYTSPELDEEHICSPSFD